MEDDIKLEDRVKFLEGQIEVLLGICAMIIAFSSHRPMSSHYKEFLDQMFSGSWGELGSADDLRPLFGLESFPSTAKFGDLTEAPFPVLKGN